MPFGDSPQGAVHVLTIGSPPGPVLEVLDLGATVHRLWVTGGDDVRRNVVLGHATVTEYLESADYIGATIGRYANRIKAGRFPLDGETVEVGVNDRGNCLHGGPEGFDKRLWQVVHQGDDQLALTMTSPGGDQGFPGELIVRAVFETTTDSVRLRLEATTDAPTVVNLTSHAYFNLDGDGSGTIGGQLLRVDAERYHSVDDTGIPLDATPVADSAFDLRESTRLSDAIARTGGIDHDYVLSAPGGPRPAAVLDSPTTRSRMELSTDQPGLQVYTGLALDGTGRSTTGEPYVRSAGLALEPQLFPDTPNRPDFGSAVVRPGERYQTHCEWRFSHLPDGAVD